MKACFFITLCFLFNACAYTWGPRERQLPGGHETIHVKMFENRTQEVGIETDVTNAMIQELARSGIGNVVSSGKAEVQLEGVIHTVDFLGKTSITTDDSIPLFSEYQTRMSVMITAIDTKTKKKLWSGQFLGEKNYRAPQLTRRTLRTANPLYNQSGKRQIIRQIAKEMASEAMTSMMENF